MERTYEYAISTADGKAIKGKIRYDIWEDNAMSKEICLCPFCGKGIFIQCDDWWWWASCDNVSCGFDLPGVFDYDDAVNLTVRVCESIKKLNLSLKTDINKCKLPPNHKHDLEKKYKKHKLINMAGENAYYYCGSCGLELHGETVGAVAAGSTYADTDEHGYCPECNAENSVNWDNEEV